MAAAPPEARPRAVVAELAGSAQERSQDPEAALLLGPRVPTDARQLTYQINGTPDHWWRSSEMTLAKSQLLTTDASELNRRWPYPLLGS